MTSRSSVVPEITARDADLASVHPRHSPRVHADEGTPSADVPAMASVAVDDLLEASPRAAVSR